MCLDLVETDESLLVRTGEECVGQTPRSFQSVRWKKLLFSVFVFGSKKIDNKKKLRKKIEIFIFEKM